MPRLEYLSFDTKIFNYKVGRIDLSDESSTSPCLLSNVEIQGLLQEGHSSNYKLIYLFAPIMHHNTTIIDSFPIFPGLKVDVKTTLSVPLLSLDRLNLINKTYSLDKDHNIRIKIYPKSDIPSQSLRDLAIASGQWSRFRVDSNISTSIYEDMFTEWITNSINQSLADITFVAYDVTTEEEIGFITLKKRDNIINIGLLAVSHLHRRKGIATMLLCRGALWGLEQNFSKDAMYTVVTQGNNETALSCYKQFGFNTDITQDIYHIWLPQHLEEPLLRSDQGFIPYCKQYFTGKEMEYVGQVFNTGLDSSSRFTTMCASKMKELLGNNSQKVVIVPSGTAALEMAALLININIDDEIIMPSYTFSSTANAFVLRGGIPVFVDIKRDTLNIDENLIESAITSKTRAIVVVHYAGVPCEMDTILSIANKYNLYVIEDAAQALMSTYKGKKCGSIGHFGCFSFHYTKNIICGEGGAISINKVESDNVQIAENLSNYVRRSLILWEKGTNRHDFLLGKIDKYEWIDVGSSYVPNEVSCAILWAQLERCNEISTSRLANYEFYYKGLKNLDDSGFLKIPSVPDDCVHNAHIFYIILPTTELKNYIADGLKEKGISAFSHYIPLHSTVAGKKFGKYIGNMNITEYVFNGLLRLPVWIGLKAEDINYVVTTIQNLASNYKKHE